MIGQKVACFLGNSILILVTVKSLVSLHELYIKKVHSNKCNSFYLLARWIAAIAVNSHAVSPKLISLPLPKK